MKFNIKYLPKSDVVFSVMFINKELCEKTLEVILGEKIELKDVVAEAKNDLHQAALNSIYFDVRTQTLDGRIVTLDLQRKYLKDRVRSRTVYYACREVADQKVQKGKYENLKNVVVTFLLTEAALKYTADNKAVFLKDEITGERYSDLLSIHEVNIKHISEQNTVEMQILRDFFEMNTQEDCEQFVKKYENTYYGKLLIDTYNSVVGDVSILDRLGEEDKYMLRLSDEERLEERQEGKKEGSYSKAVEVAKSMLQDDIPIQTIMKYTGLTKDEIEGLTLKA